MKTYTIKINKNDNNNNFSFRTSNNPSKRLDDIILSNLIKMNPFLRSKKNTIEDPTLRAAFDEAGFNTDDRIIIPNNSYPLKGISTEFAEAANFLSSYTPTKRFYTISDTPIEFFEDEIQIGNTLIPLYKLTNTKYYNTFDSKTKNIIINLYISINR